MASSFTAFSLLSVSAFPRGPLELTSSAVSASAIVPVGASGNFSVWTDMAGMPWENQQRSSQLHRGVNWKQGEDVIIVPAVSDADAKQAYSGGWRSPKPYIRIVPQP